MKRLLFLILSILLPTCTYHLTAIEHEIGASVGRERGGWYSASDGAASESGEWTVMTKVKTIWGRK